ncbi:unnamed protein product [Mytilus coruscus]|uniref:Uncharacterized protein n=1 Tax=Mytilus coruscus TaxID=42192 RepID=A0A6J8ACC0_MYTCO|nr:unnamed protein product [Mytilus coruscus]
MRNHSSELQIFIGTKEFESEIRTQEREVEELNRDHQLNKRRIVFQENIKLSVFDSEISSLGDVAIEMQPSTICYTKSKEKQAQSTVHRRNFDDINLKVEKLFNFKGKYVFGSTILENDTLCFADFATNSLNIKYANESTFHSIDLHIKPYDLSNVDSQTLAVTTGSAGRKILIVNLKEKSVEKTINTEHYCCGVSFFDGNLIYSSRSKGLLSLNLQNGIVKELDIGSQTADVYVAVHDGKIYCTDNKTPLIQCYNADKTLAWEFKDKSLCEPRGIAVDKSGIVYVGNQGGGTVVMISQDGSKHKTFNIEGIPNPRTLSFKKARTRLLICGLEGSAGIFDVL